MRDKLQGRSTFNITATAQHAFGSQEVTQRLTQNNALRFRGAVAVKLCLNSLYELLLYALFPFWEFAKLL